MGALFRRPQTTVTLPVPQFNGSLQGRPLPVIYGIHKLQQGIYLCDIWNRQAFRVNSAPKKKVSTTVGWNYSANVAMALGMGPFQRLYQIFASDVLIWPETGPDLASNPPHLDLTSFMSCEEAVNAGRSYSPVNTALGQIKFYWGFGDSSIDPDLAAVTSGGVAIGSPAYRWVCYWVAVDLQFSASQSPPQLTFVVGRSLDETIHGTLTSFWPWRYRYKTIGREDAYLADIVASEMTNPISGAGLPLEKLDEASFIAAATLDDTNASGLSPVFDDSTSLQANLGDVLAYYNAFLYFDNGLIYLTLPLPASGTLPVIDPSMLTDEPDLDQGTYWDTWNETKVTYTDRTQYFQTGLATYHDAANAAILGQPIAKQIDRKHFSQAGLAQQVAETIGQLNGVPINTVTLVVRSLLTGLTADQLATFPDGMKINGVVRCASFVPGQIISLSYPPLGIDSMPLRIQKVTLSKPTDAKVTLECQTDASIQAATALHPVAAAAPFAPDIAAPAPATVKIAGLTTSQLNGSPDGMLICASRPNSFVTKYTALANWNTITDYAPLGTFPAFVSAATLNRWRRYDATGRILIDITTASDLDQSTLTDNRTAMVDLYFVAMIRRQEMHTPSDLPQLVPGWGHVRLGGRFALVSANRWEIEIEPGSEGSLAFALESFRAPVDGLWPTQTCFIGGLSDFGLFTSSTLHIFEAGANDPDDTDMQRFFSFPTSTPFAQEDQTDATAIVLDQPTGTLTPDWGARCQNNEYVTLVCQDGATCYWRLADTVLTSIFSLESGDDFDLEAGDGFALEETPALDNFSSSSDGFYSSGVTLGQSTALTLEVADASVLFNGAQMLSLGNGVNVQLAVGSLELLVKAAAPGLSRRALAVKFGAYGLYLISGKPSWHDFSTDLDYTAANSIADGDWHHLVLTWSGSMASLYVDGALVLSNALTIQDQLSPLIVAAHQQSGHAAAFFITADLDEIALYPTELTLSQVQAHHAAFAGAW